MSLLHFPSNPTVGQQYANANGIVYTWDGVKWLGAVTGSTISTIGYGTYTVSVNTAGNFVIPAGAIIEHADGSPAEFPGGTLINGPYRFTLTTSGSITLNGELFHSGGVIQSSTPPVPASTSTLWYDIGSGRSYVYYDGTWVDAAPEPSVPTHISAFTNDLGYITSTNTLVNGNQSIALDGSQGLQLNNVQYIYANSTGTAIDIYTGGTNYSEVWLFDNGPVQINTNGETHSWSFNTDGSTSLPGSLNYQVPGLGGSGHFDINSYYPVKITTGDSVDVAYSTWTFGWNGILELPGSLTGDPVVIQGAPITITISDNSGLVWGGALGTYTRLNGQTPPKWAPANYNPSSDSSITYDGGWQLNNPNFSHPLYVNTGTLTNPLTTWNPDTQFGLGSGNPVGTYTYNTWTFGLTTNSGNAGITFPDSSIQYTAWTGTVDYSNVTNAPVVDSTGTTVFNVVSATTIYINGQPVSGGTTSTLVSGTYTFAVSSTGSVTLNGVSFSSHGAQGTTGAQGTAGSNGTNGAQGTTGSTGSQGTAGSIGTNGTQGTTGAQGTAGSIGTNGTQGTTGAQGTAGTNGVQGVQGISGSASLNNLSTSISFTNTGVNPPSFVTTSTGVKISYYQQESPTTVDYATGIEPGGLWTSIPSATSNYAFKWYGGTSTLATLTGTGTFITNTLNVSNQITTPAGSNANLVLNPDGLADVIVTTSTQILMYATNTSISTTTGALVVTGGVGVGGTVTANKFVGDGSSLTNVTVTQQANIVGSQPNVTLVAGNYSYLFDNTGNFTMPSNGDIVMTGTNANLTVGGSVWGNQRKFDWTAMIHGTPATGGSITGSILNNATYSNASDGVQLTSNTTNQTGSVAWNVTGFDFTKDFVMEWSWFTSVGTNAADGVWATFGGSSNGAGVVGPTTNGAIGLRYLTYTNLKTQWFNNGSTTGNAVPFRAGVTYQGIWQTSRIMVRTIGVKRYAYVYTGTGGVCDNAIDITSWSPAGTWIAVGASTGGSISTQLCCHVALEYI